jgi:hypothetical protein
VTTIQSNLEIFLSYVVSNSIIIARYKPLKKDENATFFLLRVKKITAEGEVLGFKQAAEGSIHN